MYCLCMPRWHIYLLPFSSFFGFSLFHLFFSIFFSHFFCFHPFPFSTRHLSRDRNRAGGKHFIKRWHRTHISIVIVSLQSLLLLSSPLLSFPVSQLFSLILHFLVMILIYCLLSLIYLDLALCAETNYICMDFYLSLSVSIYLYMVCIYVMYIYHIFNYIYLSDTEAKPCRERLRKKGGRCDILKT